MLGDLGDRKRTQGIVVYILLRGDISRICPHFGQVSGIRYFRFVPDEYALNNGENKSCRFVPAQHWRDRRFFLETVAYILNLKNMRIVRVARYKRALVHNMVEKRLHTARVLFVKGEKEGYFYGVSACAYYAVGFVLRKQHPLIFCDCNALVTFKLIFNLASQNKVKLAVRVLMEAPTLYVAVAEADRAEREY